MMPSEDLFKNATDTITKAIEYDKQNKFKEASIHYKKALQMFMIVAKYERNPKAKEFLLKRINQYLSRAEELEKKQVAVVEDNVDEEKDMLKQQILNSMIKPDKSLNWDSIAGLEVAKQTLKEAVILPIMFPNMFTGARVAWKGLLLFSAPGCGKTLLASVVASVAGYNFFSVSSSDLISKYQGESERLIKTLFDTAREKAPSIIFIDEVDSVCGNRTDGENDSTRRIKTELLVQTDGVGKSNKQLLVMGATNLPWKLDPAFRRRFQKRIYIPLPDRKSRKKIIKQFLDVENNLTELDINDLVDRTDGYSGADLKNMMNDALMGPVRQAQKAKQFLTLDDGNIIPCVTYPNCSKCPLDLSTCSSLGKACEICGALRSSMYDIEPSKLQLNPLDLKNVLDALENTPKTVSKADIEKFENWMKEFGQEGG